MSKKDSTKATINVLTVAMGAILTALLAVIGYVFVNYETISFAKGCIIIIGFAILEILFGLCVLFIKKDIKRLEKM